MVTFNDQLVDIIDYPEYTEYEGEELNEGGMQNEVSQVL